jgi:hypothetical protein
MNLTLPPMAARIFLNTSWSTPSPAHLQGGGGPWLFSGEIAYEILDRDSLEHQLVQTQPSPAQPTGGQGFLQGTPGAHVAKHNARQGAPGYSYA